MKDIRKKIESHFFVFGEFAYDNPFKTLIIMAVVIVSMVSGIRGIHMDTSTESFLHPDDPILVAYDSFRDQFGRDELIIIGIQPPAVFEQAFLKKLKQFHEALEKEVPHLEEITSLVNARNTRGKGDELIVEDLLEDWPMNDQEMADLKSRVLSNLFYKNLLVSEDAGFTAVVIETSGFSTEEDSDILDGFEDTTDSAPDGNGPAARKYLTDAENTEAVNAVRKVAARFYGTNFKISIGGSPVLTHDLKQFMVKNVRLFILFAIIAISVFLYILFQRISGFLLPLIIVILSLVSTAGLMGHFNVSIKLPTNVLPTFLLAVGVGDSVHVLAIFFRQMAYGDDKKNAIAHALEHSGLAIVLTSLTTAGGLLSFSAAEVAPIAELGIFGSAGVMLAMLFTITLLPPLLALTPVSSRKQEKKEGTSILDRFLAGFGDVATSRPKMTLTLITVVITAGLVCAFQNRFSHNPVEWLPHEAPIRISTDTIDDAMKGSMSLEVVVDTGKENGLYDPENLNRLEGLKQELEGFQSGDIYVGKAIHVGDILKEIHQALNENRSEFYAIPQDPALIPQEFLLFENSGSDDLEDFVDTQFQIARFTIKMPRHDAIPYAGFIRTIEDKFNNAFKGEAEITVTGLVSILGRTLSAAVLTMARSYLIAFIIVTVLMVLMIGNLKIGLASMIPNLSPIIVAMGLIWVAKIPLDLFTMLTGSIAIGLVVDDTIHFMHNFRRYYFETKDVKKAVHNTLQTTGRAMLFTSLVLSTGFFIMTFSEMNNLTGFGLITGVTIILALLSDFLIAPALMAVIYKK